jgi:3-dehydroquinate dehydratase-2
MARLLLLNGPNLNLLGTREPEIYGRDSLADIEARLMTRARAAGHELDCFQSNAEHALIDRIHQAQTRASVSSSSIPALSRTRASPCATHS